MLKTGAKFALSYLIYNDIIIYYQSLRVSRDTLFINKRVHFIEIIEESFEAALLYYNTKFFF